MRIAGPGRGADRDARRRASRTLTVAPRPAQDFAGRAGQGIGVATSRRRLCGRRVQHLLTEALSGGHLMTLDDAQQVSHTLRVGAVGADSRNSTDARPGGIAKRTPRTRAQRRCRIGAQPQGYTNGIEPPARPLMAGFERLDRYKPTGLLHSPSAGGADYLCDDLTRFENV